MSSPVIVYSQPGNGHIAICTPVLNSGLTVEQIAQKDVPQDSPYKICSSTDLPQEGTFFDAWVYNENVPVVPITIDVERAHEIWKDEWRRVRNPILSRLDVEWMRAMEQGNTSLAQELANKKQVLRDVTSTFLPQRDSGQSIDMFSIGLKSVWPECLTW